MSLTWMTVCMSWVSVSRLREKPDHVSDMDVSVYVMGVSFP